MLATATIMNSKRSCKQDGGLHCGILHLKVGRLALAGSRRAASSRVDPVHLLDVPCGAVLGRQLQPGDRSLATGARSRARRRSDAAVLGAGDGANAQGGRVQVEEGRRAVEEVVVARHVQLHGAEGPNRGGVEVEVDGHVGHLFQQVLRGAGDVADVEERGQGAGGDGRSVGLAGVAGVVLRAAADGDVLDGQVCGWRGEKPVDCGLSSSAIGLMSLVEALSPCGDFPRLRWI